MMNEFLKYLIAILSKKKWTAELLLVVALIIVTFWVGYIFLTTPNLIPLLNNLYFQWCLIAIITIWAASLPWRYRVKKIKATILTGIIITLGLVSSYQIIVINRFEPISVRVIFDQNIMIDQKSLQKIVSIIDSPLLSIQILDTPIVLNAVSNNTLVADDACDIAIDFSNKFNKNNAILPVLITNKILAGRDWGNLLWFVRDDSVVISIAGVGDSETLSDPEVLKYISTSVVLQTLSSKALKKDEQILTDRTPGIYQGCLYDFHRTRETYISQTQHPEFCGIEAECIQDIFGKQTLKKTSNMLLSISNL